MRSIFNGWAARAASAAVQTGAHEAAHKSAHMSARKAALTAAVAAITALAGCGGGGGYAGDPAPAPLPQVTFAVSNGAGINGTLVLTLENTLAPVTVANFLAYVNAGFYNGTIIHRNLPGFVLQGGVYAGPVAVGPTTPAEKLATRPPIVLEDNAGLLNVRYTVAMARMSAPNSATASFFINLANNPILNRRGATDAERGFAVFGSVTANTALVDAMAIAPCSEWLAFLPAGECLPTPNIVITSATQTR